MCFGQDSNLHGDRWLQVGFSKCARYPHCVYQFRHQSKCGDASPRFEQLKTYYEKK